MSTPHRLLSAALGCALTGALGLAVGCTPDSAPGAGPDQRSLVLPSPSPLASVQPAGDSPAASTVSYRTQVAPLLQDRCAACHSGAGSGGVSLFSNSGSPSYSNIKGKLPKILSEVEDGGMPQGGPRLTQAQVQLLETWRTEGAPDN